MSKGLPSGVEFVPILKFIDRLVGKFRSEVSAVAGGEPLPSLTSLGRQSEVVRRLIEVYERGTVETRSRAQIVAALEVYEFSLNRLETEIRRGVKASIVGEATGDRFELGFAREQARQVGSRLRDFTRATNELRRVGESTESTDAGRAVLQLLQSNPVPDQEGRSSDIWEQFRAEIESEQGRLGENQVLQQVPEETQRAEEDLEQRDQPRGRVGDNSDTAGLFNRGTESSNNLSDRVREAARAIQERYGQIPAEIRDVIEEQARQLRDSLLQRVKDSMSDVQGQNQTKEMDARGEGGDQVDARPVQQVRSDRADEPANRRPRLDENDGPVAAGRSASGGNTTEVATRQLAPNQVVAPGSAHLPPFDHNAAIDLAESMIDHAAQQQGSSVLLTTATDMFIQKQSQKPTYRFNSQGHRGDITADTRSQGWQLSSTTRIGDSETSPGAAGTTFAGFIGGTFCVTAFQNPALPTEQYVINDNFKDALPPANDNAQKWYYILEQQNRVGGTFAEVVLARALEAQTRERMTGSLTQVMCRLVADLLWYRTGLFTNSAPEIGGGRITMRASDDQPDLWRSWPYQQTGVSGTFINEPLVSTGFWQQSDLDRLRALDGGAISITRLIRSRAGDNSRNVVGQRADGSEIFALPEGWTLENTAFIPIRSTDANQTIVNNYWMRAHIGLTQNVDKEVNAWWPNETADGADINTWFTGLGTVSFAPSAVAWRSMAHVQHVMFVFIDRGSTNTNISIGNGEAQRIIETADDVGDITITQNLLGYIVFQPDVDVATVDQATYVLTAMQRYDEIYHTTQMEIRDTMAFLTRHGYWTNELPKAQGEQGLSADDFGSNCMNIQLTDSNVLYNSFPNQGFRNRYVPTIGHPTSRSVTSMLGVWANAGRTIMRPARTGQEINLHGIHLSQVAGVQFDFGSALGNISSVGGFGVHEARGLVPVARAMNVLELPGVKMNSASVDWPSAYAGTLAQAADVLSYALDDALGMGSISVREAGWYEGNNLDGDGLYLLKGKMMPNIREVVERVISPTGACWKMDVQNWGTKDAWADGFDFVFNDNITGTDIFAGIEAAMQASRRQGSLAAPCRVGDYVLALETTGPTRDYAMAIVHKTAVDFSTTGATVITAEQPPNITNPQRVGQLLPQMMFSSDTPYMVPGDMRMLSCVQNVSQSIRRTEAFLLDEVACSPTPFFPVESVTILSPASDPANLFAQGLIDFRFRMPCSSADATKDVRNSSRIRFQAKPWVWERIGIKTSSQLARMTGGVNPGLPYTYIQIGQFSSLPVFDQENAGEGDPRRQLTQNPGFLN